MENGAWDNKKKDDVIVTLNGWEGDTLKLKEQEIPSVGKEPEDDTYTAGGWNVEPDAERQTSQRRRLPGTLPTTSRLRSLSSQGKPPAVS